MIAVDTNLLVYAHRPDSEWHEPAAKRIRELAEGRAPWAIPWQCVHEFVGIVTHPRIFDPSTPLDTALDAVDAWLESPSLLLLSETPRYWQTLRELLRAAVAVGPRIHDARVAALCLAHDVRELWTADRDFGRFPALVTRNPLVAER